MSEELEPAAEVLDGELVERLLVPITEQETYDEKIMAEVRKRCDDARDDAWASFKRRRELVHYPFDPDADERQVEATVKSIANWGASFALGRMVNPDRVVKV